MRSAHGIWRLIELTAARLFEGVGAAPQSAGAAEAAPNPEAPGDPNSPADYTALHALYRAAWTAETVPLVLSHIPRLLDVMPGQPIAIDVQALDPSVVFPASTGRIVSNLLLLAAESLPSGGAVVLVGAVDDLFIKVIGPGAAWPPGMELCFADEAEARAAVNEWRHPQMALTALLAHACGKRLSLLIAPVAGNGPPILRLSG